MDTNSAESRIAEFIAKYTAEMAAEIIASRKKLRALFPRGYELVFDNYNALVFGIAPSDKTRDSFLSIAAYPRWITLFFLNGASLIDPNRLLQGAGKQVRGIRLNSSADLDRRDIKELISQACSQVANDLSKAPPLSTVVKQVSAKQRPRRPPEKVLKPSCARQMRNPR